MNIFTIGCFYTKNTEYENLYKSLLKESIDKFSLDSLVSERDNKGTWYKNVAEKPLVILEMLEYFRIRGFTDRKLVFLDVDSNIVSYPKLFEEIPDTYDIAFHRLDWRMWYGHNVNTKELLTGTMWFNNNDKVRDLCKEWYNEAVKTNMWEQKVLEQILPNHPEISVYELPIEYCYIATMPDGSLPKVKVDSVILHYQKSRELKRSI